MFAPPVPIIHWLVLYGIDFLIIAMLIRAIASWFNISGRFAFLRFLEQMTDPFILPVRRVIKPVWIIDIGFLIAWFLLLTLQTLLLQALPAGW